MRAFLKHTAAASVVTRDGIQYLGDQEVVFATKADLARLPIELQEGFFLVGTGDTGAAAAFMTLAAVYGGAMASGAMLMKVFYIRRDAAGRRCCFAKFSYSSSSQKSTSTNSTKHTT